MTPEPDLATLQEWLRDAPAPPRDAGSLRLICLRRRAGVHDTPEAAEVTASAGLAGDRWSSNGRRRDPDGATAITLIRADVAERLTAGRHPLHEAGDNLVVDLDLSVETLPPGSRLRIGETVELRISEQPHTGCSTFSSRFGLDALRWVSTPDGKARRLRGVNASVVTPGTVRVGDAVTVVARPVPSVEPMDSLAG